MWNWSAFERSGRMRSAQNAPLDRAPVVDGGRRSNAKRWHIDRLRRLDIPVASPSSRSHRSSRPHDTEQAVQIYARAVESEQSGKLNEALILYRRAFKMDGETNVGD